MNFFINHEYIFILINSSLYYINYLFFYTIAIILFQKNVILIFEQAYKKYVFNKKNNYMILNQENKHILSLKKTYKEKNKVILFFKESIEAYIVIKNNTQLAELEKNKMRMLQSNIDKENIKKTLYNNHLLEYTKDSFQKILFNKFENNTDITFVMKLLKQ